MAEVELNPLCRISPKPFGIVTPSAVHIVIVSVEQIRQVTQSGDSPEVGERSFAALRMTKPLPVILSAAKDLWGITRPNEQEAPAIILIAIICMCTTQEMKVRQSLPAKELAQHHPKGGR